jgi:hypothetical protein
MPAETTLPCVCTSPECVGPRLVIERGSDVVLLSIESTDEIAVDRRALARALGYDLALIPREDA